MADRRERAGDVVGWLVVAPVGLVMLTQAVGWQGTRLVATVHALTPHLLAAVVVVAGVATWRGRHPLAVISAVIGLSGLALANPLVFPPGQPDPVEGATGLRVAAVNLLYTNPSIDAAADTLRRQDADVVVFSEYTAEHQAALLAHPLADAYPHRVERDGLAAGGTAVWSKFPLGDVEQPDTYNYSLDLVVDGPDGPVRVLAVHAPTHLVDLQAWKRELRVFGDLALLPGPPTLLIGDFNASWWHPGFRDLLARGLDDAHISLRRGWSASWPTDWVVPPFVRLDHALTTDELVSTDVVDFRLPGSDHTGLVVTVVPAR